MFARILDRRQIYAATTLAVFGLLLSAPVGADETPPARSDLPQNTAPPPAAVNQSESIAGQASSSAGGQPVAPPASAEGDVVAGPLFEKRQAFYQKLMQAREKGIGITNYLDAFKGIEAAAKGGEAEAALSKRLDSLATSLSDQLKRSVILKTQKLPPPIAASSPPPSASAGGATSAGGGAPGGLSAGPGTADGNELLARLRGKYGDHIPDSIKDKLPGGIPSDPSKLLNDPNVRDMLKGLKKN